MARQICMIKCTITNFYLGDSEKERSADAGEPASRRRRRPGNEDRNGEELECRRQQERSADEGEPASRRRRRPGNEDRNGEELECRRQQERSADGGEPASRRRRRPGDEDRHGDGEESQRRRRRRNRQSAPGHQDDFGAEGDASGDHRTNGGATWQEEAVEQPREAADGEMEIRLQKEAAEAAQNKKKQLHVHIHT
ncbi:pre-mRNA-splicing factor 38B-like [Drosophila suzukii]|uniref:Pre-mRNA-splicing factor 38B-like n=1 Tax=Drosophila suzukii TaxID=28584 RepID=A0AB40DA43_DROSZ